MVDSNLKGYTGYGLDELTQQAEDIILAECGLSKGEGHGTVFFLTGGTQTNSVAVDWLCRPGEGVLATADAHINVHESGAIEAFGHKVIVLPSEAGKLKAEDVEYYMSTYYSDPTWPHMVRPAMVYISQPTELGTLYKYGEIAELRDVCTKYNLALYIDGARMIYALAAPDNDLHLSDIASLATMFYIGGTKAGTLYGEALVTKISTERERLFAHIKRHGALLAKGWLSASQFKALFSNSLYKRIGNTAIEISSRLRGVLLAAGCREIVSSQTNQLFFELSDTQLQSLEGQVIVDIQKPIGTNTHLVRFVSDWSNTLEQVSIVAKLLGQQ